MPNHRSADFTPQLHKEYIQPVKMLVLCSLLAAAGLAGVGPAGTSTPAHDEAARGKALDLAGGEIDPFRQAGSSKALVFIFIANECPICNRFVPEIRRLEAEFKKRGVGFWLVHADPTETVESIRTHAKEYQLDLPVLRDPRQVLVRRAEERITPEAAVFLPNGRLVYRGRINDRYVDFGKERAVVTQHDLRDALLAVLAGKEPLNAKTRAIGCYIPELKESPPP